MINNDSLLFFKVGSEHKNVLDVAAGNLEIFFDGWTCKFEELLNTIGKSRRGWNWKTI